MASWLDYMANPRGQALKKTMFEVLKERYQQNEQIIDRIGVSLTTESDVSGFMKLVSDIYEIAYLKSVNDHKEQLQKMGITSKVVAPNDSSRQ